MSGRIDTEDAFTWLRRAEGAGPVVASIPTATELDLEPDLWDTWATSAAAACIAAAGPHPAIFVQTDRLADSTWHSWPAKIARANGDRPFIWHKIALTRDPDHTDLFRPTYRHVIAAGHGTPGKRTPDVWHDGPRNWENGTGIITAWKIATYITQQTSGLVLNPFAGSGTLIDAITEAGREAVGCDNDPRWARSDPT